MTLLTYLSYELGPDTPTFGDNGPVELVIDRGFDSGPYLQHRLSTVNHNGTHVDVPLHFNQNGNSLSEFSAQDWLFEAPQVIELTVPDGHTITGEDLAPFADSLRDTDALLIRTGFGDARADARRYLANNPGFSESAADFLLDYAPALRALFADVPSFTAASNIAEGVRFHQRMLGRSAADRFVVLFEDVDLRSDLTNITKVWAFPLRLAGLDGAPATIVAELRGIS